MKKNVRIRVRENCNGTWWGFGIFEGNKLLFLPPDDSYLRKYYYKANAIRHAKAMSERIGIGFDPEIIKQHGC